jgi:hypothetical protein
MDVYKEEVSIQGRPRMVDAVRVGNNVIVVTGTLMKMARLKEEWFEDAEDPERTIAELRKAPLRTDIFTFFQRLPDKEPRYPFYRESETVAAIPITSYDHWWKKQVNPKTRNMVRKAEKSGLVIRETQFDDDFVKGVAGIFNETPLRQNKPFWHYGKNEETIKKQFSRYIFREDMIGAYYQDEMIGFMMLAHAGQYALLGQILSKVAHRDKAVTNALLAKAVEICARKNIPYLSYYGFRRGGLGDFQRHNGFEMITLPRYYVPLTAWGRLVLQMNLHNGLKQAFPEHITLKLIDLRTRWYHYKYRNFNVAQPQG